MRTGYVTITISCLIVVLLTSAAAFAGNLAPTKPTGIAVTPDPAYKNTNLTATGSGSTDADGPTPLTYIYSWRSSTDGGAHWSGWLAYSTAPLSCTTNKFAVGMKWQVKAKAKDGAGKLSAEYISPKIITIVNKPPSEPTTVTVTPATPTTYQDLTVTASGSTDLEGDKITYAFHWEKWDGSAWVDAGVSAATLSHEATLGNQHWRALAQAVAGSGTSAWVPSAEIVIANTVPTAPAAVGITPANPDSATQLVGAASGATDPDGTTPTYEFQWRCDEGAGYHVWGKTRPTLPASATAEGQAWQVRARATDGQASSAWVEMEDSVTIVNAAPTVPVFVKLDPGVPGKESLTGAASGSVDADGDPITYQYQWSKISSSSTHVTAWTANAGQVLPASTVNFGDTWQVRARAFDGANYSRWKAHKTVKIVRMVSWLSPATEATNVARDASIYITFRWPVDQASVEGRLKLYYSGDVPIPGRYTWCVPNVKVRFNPTPTLRSNTRYRIHLTPGVRCSSGRVLGWREDYFFRTAPATAPATVAVAASPTAAGAQVTVNLGSAASVQAVICNIAGRVVAELPERDLPSGVSSLLWNGKSRTGSNVPAGNYLVRVTARGAEGAQTSAVTPLMLRR